MTEVNLSTVAWFVLFGEQPEKIPDINKPENSAYLNARQKEHAEKFRRFVEGDGSPLFEKWQNRVRSGIFDIMNPGNTPECNCGLSTQVREFQFLFKLLAEAYTITEENIS